MTKPETPIWAQLTPMRKEGNEYYVRMSCCKTNSYKVPERCIDTLRAAQPKGMFKDGIEICSSCMKPFDEPSIPYPYKCCWVCLEHYKKNARAEGMAQGRELERKELLDDFEKEFKASYGDAELSAKFMREAAIGWIRRKREAQKECGEAVKSATSPTPSRRSAAQTEGTKE